MSKYIGRKISVGIGKETVRGTSVVPDFWIQKLTLDFDEKKETVLDESSIGVISDSMGQDATKRWAEGGVTGNVSDQSLGLFLLSTFGAVSSSLASGETIVYEHEFSIANTNQHQSLTFSTAEDNGDYQFANAMISSLELSFSPDDYATMTANFMAKKGEAASLTPAYGEENKFVGRNVCIFFADDLAGLDAAEAIGGISASLTIEKNIDPAFEFCSIDPTDFFNQQIGGAGSIELYYDDETYKTLALDNSAKAMRIRIKDSNKTIGVASNPGVDFDYAKVYLNEFAKTGDNNEMVKQALAFQSVYNQTEAAHMTAKLTNEVVSY